MARLRAICLPPITIYSIYNIARSVFEMRPPTRMHAKLKKREQEVNTLIEQLQLKTQRWVHEQKEKLRKERTVHFEIEDAGKLERVQLKSQIKDLQDLLADVLEQACARV